jgi:uncharacterized protein (UPF0548 family)
MRITIGGFEKPFESSLYGQTTVVLNYSAEEIPGFRQDYYVKDFSALGGADALFEKLSGDLFQYKIFPKSVMKFVIGSPTGTIEKDVLIFQRVKLGPICINTAVKVLRTIKEETAFHRKSEFRYGTLVGHPEKGEAWFRVTLDKTTQLVKFEMGASSTAGNFLARLGTPMTRFIQKTMTLMALKNFGTR